MSGDYSRSRFDPSQHYQGVLQQQGRVALDADNNEQIEIQDRRWRAETIDVIGRCGVPSATPEGFKIGRQGGTLTIGPGRMYVDGLLAENHATAPVFDARLEEEYGNEPIAIQDQPYRGAAIDGKLNGLRWLVYLVAWRREVTHLQDPALIERAVNIDTTTRLQTAWQVRLLKDLPVEVTSQTPLEEIANWPAAMRPSAARLSTATTAVNMAPEPCLVPPSGGYRGLENHLYQVAVHDVGPAGRVRVKWSRENANVATTVLEISDGGTCLRVESIGRDGVLRFEPGVWAEITSDQRELSGLPGVMCRVASVDDAAQTLRITPPLLPVDFPDGATEAAHHVRVIRWDQSGIVRGSDGSPIVNLDNSGDGLIPLDATAPSAPTFLLEHGIVATLEVLAGGSARSGDHWCFVARTADANIETLEKAAPAGIHYHSYKLAIIEENGEVVDCRPVFSALTEIVPGCCTAVVKPGDDIQAALDGLPESGGCVCLKAGVHEIFEALRIERSNVSLRGETLGARIVRNNGIDMLKVRDPAGLFLKNVTVSDLRFACAGNKGPVRQLAAIVSFDRCIEASFERCRLRAEDLAEVVGIGIRGCTDMHVASCEIAGVGYGVRALEDSQRVLVRGNILDGFSRAGDGIDAGIVAVFLEAALDRCQVEGNRISRFTFGIALNQGLLSGTPFSGATGSVISGNSIVRLAGEAGTDAEKVFAIDTAAHGCRVTGNELVHNSGAHGGIVVSGVLGAIEDNSIRCLATVAGEEPSIGIMVGRVLPNGILGSIGGRVARNTLVGPQDFIAVFDNSGVEVEDNRLASAIEARYGVLLRNVDNGRVRGNRISNARLAVAVTLGARNVVDANLLSSGSYGVTATIHGALDVTENRIEDMSQSGFFGSQLMGRARLSDNRVVNCGYQSPLAVGIGVSEHLGDLHIESCEVVDTGVSPDAAVVSPTAWGIVANLVLDLRVQGNVVTYSNPAVLVADAEHRALWMKGVLERVLPIGSGKLAFGFSAHVLDNKFVGPGKSALVEAAAQEMDGGGFRRFERLFFSNNFCWHVSSPKVQPKVSVSLKGKRAVVMGNHFKSDPFTSPPVPSVDFHGMEDAVYLGNIAPAGPQHFNGVPTPVSNFNKP